MWRMADTAKSDGNVCVCVWLHPGARCDRKWKHSLKLYLDSVDSTKQCHGAS